MGKLNHLMGLQAADRMERETDQYMLNRAAEEGHVRKTVWGFDEAAAKAKQSESDSDSEDPEVPSKQTILGDITTTHPAPIVVSAPAPNTGPSPLVSGLIGALAAAGLIYAGSLSRKPDDRPDNDTRYEMTLEPGDYLDR